MSVAGEASVVVDGDRRSASRGSALTSAALTAGNEVAKDLPDQPGRRVDW